jgi:hypothetical protein
MSVVSRIVLAGLVSVSVIGVQARAAENTGETGHTGARLLHATKCLGTFGFGEGCDKDAPVTKEEHSAHKAEKKEALAAVSTDTSPRRQLEHAAKCVGTFGFGGGCDKKQPYGTVANPKASEPAAVDTGNKSRLLQAAKCVGTFGFLGDCEKADAR